MPSRLKSVVTNKSCAGGTLSRAQSSPMPNAARLLAPLAAARRMRAIRAFSRSGTDANIDEDLLPAQAAQFSAAQESSSQQGCQGNLGPGTVIYRTLAVRGSPGSQCGFHPLGSLRFAPHVAPKSPGRNGSY